MSTLIDKQVEAFGDAVMEAHREAALYGDVQDVVSATPGVVESISDIITQRQSVGAFGPQDNHRFADLCRRMLGHLAKGYELIGFVEKLHFTVQGVAEFDEAVLRMRELLAELVDEQSPEAAAPVDYQKLSSAAESHPPAESWFEEDHRKLRGPRHA